MQAELVAGRYRILGELGSGAMGFVWRAHDEVLDRDVALKELRISGGLDRSEARERFVTEARAAARLSHPSIVTVHDVFQESERVLLSMELLDGQTLDEILRGGPLGAAARPIMREVAAALAVAHSAGVVHRDLKPENIFLTDIGRVVVCDFGLARIGTGGLTEIGTVMGTPGFMAPEQLTGESVTPSADVFAWGAVAYELASGQPAFGDRDLDSGVALAYKVVHEAPAGLRIDDDPAFSPVVATALQRHPDERFADGVCLLAALDGVVDAPLPVALAIPAPASPPRPRGSVIAAAILVALVCGLGTVLLMLLGGDPPALPPAVEGRESARTDQRVVPFDSRGRIPSLHRRRPSTPW